MKDYLFVIYRLENEVCDDSYVEIVNVYNDIKNAEKKLYSMLEDEKRILLNEKELTPEEIEDSITLHNDNIGFYKYEINLDDTIINAKIECIKKEF